MNREQIRKASKLLEELEKLEEYKYFSDYNDENTSVHFEMCANYTSRYDNVRILIPKRYNNRFVKLLEEIINEIKQELENI